MIYIHFLPALLWLVHQTNCLCRINLYENKANALWPATNPDEFLEHSSA